MYTFHRSELLNLLGGHVRDADKVFHFSKRLDTYLEPADGASGPVTLKFKDGTEATCDLLVGSDGVRSAVRRTMYTLLAEEAIDQEKAAELRAHIEPKWSGWITIRGLIPGAMLSEETKALVDRPTMVSILG